MTFYLKPSVAAARLLIVRTETAHAGHSGLGINTMHTVRVLRAAHVHVDSLTVATPGLLAQHLQHHPGVTHCIIEAPWISTDAMKGLCLKFPHVHFVVRAHSQIGFLQSEAGALRLIREQLVLQEQVPNFSSAANSEKLAAFLRQVYTAECLHLPNLYLVDRAHHRTHEPHMHRTLRIGAFGAIRVLKNHLSAAAAALLIAQRRNADVEFHFNGGREEKGNGVVHAMQQLYRDVPYARLVQVPWADWPQFRRRVAHMDLCMQPSMTETFNLVTADAAAEGVPSVVGSAIEWVPTSWHADIDSVEDIARVGSCILSDRYASEHGKAALTAYAESATQHWLRWLARQPHDSR